MKLPRVARWVVVVWAPGLASAWGLGADSYVVARGKTISKVASGMDVTALAAGGRRPVLLVGK